MTSVAPVDAATIRTAVRADLLAVLRIERAVFSQPWTMDAFEQFLDEPGFLVAEAPAQDGGPGGEILGYVVATGVTVNGTAMGHVKDLAVAPDRQGRGLGSRLLDRALSILAGRGFDRVRLEVRESNERAIDLYEQFGFRHVQTYPGYYPDGEDALILHAPL
ncbi:MAG: ribosomal protein S18-alanine N-acetyltransferase [Halanaeroarchaeum sp.]